MPVHLRLGSHILILIALAGAHATENSQNNTDPEVNKTTRSRSFARIFDGALARKGQIPYIVALVPNKNWNIRCTGSIIGRRWVITASHCLKGFESVLIIYGESNIRKPKIKHIVGRDNFLMHPKYSEEKLRNDIALIRTPKITYTKFIQKALLPNPDIHSKLAGLWSRASGWGVTRKQHLVQLDLFYIDIPISKNSVCNGFEFSNYFIERCNICVAMYKNMKPCSGDSGGPLVLRKSRILVGVLSFGLMLNCKDSAPEVYVRVTNYLGWIRKMMKNY